MEAIERNDVAAVGPVYSIEGLLQKAAVVSQQKIFAKLDGLVRVKGVVTKVTRKSYACYLTVEDRGFSISVKCDPETVAEEAQPVIVEGVLLLKPSTFFTGLESCIDGHVVGAWQPTLRSENNQAALPDKSRYIRLEDFLSEHDPASLLILGTEVAMTDVLSQLDASLAAKISRRIVRVGKKDSLLCDLKDVVDENASAVAIVRGGNDQSMNLWNDREVIATLLAYEVPFYTALGHTHSTSLADRYADESFHTPGIFGASLNSIVRRSKQFDALDEECRRLEQENAILDQRLRSLSTAKNDNKKATSEGRLWVYLICAAVIAYGLYKFA